MPLPSLFDGWKARVSKGVLKMRWAASKALGRRKRLRD
jgi:hypothetical protein